MPLDPNIARLFKIESGGNPYAVTGSNRGLGQFGPAEERQYGITDANRSDPNAQAAAVQAEWDRFRPILASKLGRDPTPGELYLMHQQGIAGGPALLSADPNQPAWQAIRPYYNSDAMAQKAIGGNIPTGSALYGQDPSGITAGDFSKFWVSKFEGGLPAGGQPLPIPENQPATYADYAKPPLTPGSPAPPLGAPINIDAPSPGLLAQNGPGTSLGPVAGTPDGLLGGGMARMAGLLGGGDQFPALPKPQMPIPIRPHVDVTPLLNFLQARRAPSNWSV